MPLDLPPIFDVITLRESGKAFDHAKAIVEKGAGTFVWARRYHFADFAVVLEPAQPLCQAVQGFYSGMNALADALAFHCPPENPISIEWPDALIVDGGLVGGGRMAWPDTTKADEVPAWMVFGAMVRVSAPEGAEVGAWSRGTSLMDEGFEDVSPQIFIESAARHLVFAMHRFEDMGADAEAVRYREHLSGVEALPSAGALLDRLSQPPSWLDPESGEPRR